MFCALLGKDITQVSVYRTIGPLVTICKVEIWGSVCTEMFP